MERGALVERSPAIPGEALADEVATEQVRQIARQRLVRLGVPDQDLDDLVQDTVTALFRSASAYDPGRGSVPAWVSGFASNIAKKWWRQCTERNRTESPLDEGDVVVQEPREAGLDEILGSALDRLSPVDRELLHLRYQHELSFDEIGQLTSFSAATARKRVSRSLARLRAQCGPSRPSGRAAPTR